MKNKKQPHGQRKKTFKLGRLKNNNPACDLCDLPQCKAKSKTTGKRRGNRAMKGKRVCRIHGGKSPGAPKGNLNALKHGRYSEQVKEEKRKERELLEIASMVIKALNEGWSPEKKTQTSRTADPKDVSVCGSCGRRGSDLSQANSRPDISEDRSTS